MNFSRINILIIIFFLFCSLSISIYFVGPTNFLIFNTDWLYGAGDPTNAQLSWQYFQKSDWYFPLGKNPDYGLELSNSIVFTDNIPLLAIFFKILSPLLSDKFQYFSFWIFICLFLQLTLAYLILLKATQDNLFSLLSSFLFLLTPFLFFRLSHHFSLGAHWLILYTFYLSYFKDENEKSLHWFLLIGLSLLIHFYFTLMIFVIYSCFILEKALIKKKLSPFLELIYKIIFALVIMYIIGYFESSPINSLSTGYGKYKIDLLSFFDPKIDGQESWSYFLKDLNITHLEGFNYIGLGNIVFLFSATIILIYNIRKPKKTNFEFFRIANLYIIIFFLWALTTNLSINGKEIININLHDYIFALLSIFGSTGRFAWPVIYIFLIFSSIYLYKNFNKFYSKIFIALILIIQISDTSIGVKNNSFKQYKNESFDPIWKSIDNEFEEIRTTYLHNNYGPLFSNFSKILGRLDNIKTDIILNAALDREKAANVRYKLIEKVSEKKLNNNTAYIVDNKGHLNQLKKITSDKNFGFFYRDNLWVMLPDKKDQMNKDDILRFNEINFENIDYKKVYNISFKDNFLGFGWSHNFGKQGAWTEGKNAFLLFKKPELTEKKIMIFDVVPYMSNKNKDFQMEIFFNDKLYKTIFLNNKKNISQIKITLKKEDYKIDNIINFRFSGLISPYEIFESPDARKLGVLLKSIRFD